VTWSRVDLAAVSRDLVEDPRLLRLMRANRLRISFEREGMDASASDRVDASGFVPLKDVPDVVWKKSMTAVFPAGRGGREQPTHFANLDEAGANGQTLFDRLNAPIDLTVTAFQDYYDNLAYEQNSERGLLPFRIWQVYDKMVEAASDRRVSEFVCAAGILAHYVGDACQVLHGSYLFDGDPARKQQRIVRNRDGTQETVLERLGKGVHSDYEDRMINEHIEALMGGVDAAIGWQHAMPLVRGGQDAAFAIVELMRRTRNRIDPIALIEAYAGSLRGDGDASEVLWNRFGTATRDAIADGCRVLAMLWESAWHEGSGQVIGDDLLGDIPVSELIALYTDQLFVPSLPLDEVARVLRLGLI
jgi:hypothetical protein